jgi:hypothetical protein
VKGFVLARVGIGTVIGRKSVSKGKEYRRIWIYIPTKVAEDTSFQFKVGDPCFVEIDTSRGWLVIKPISLEEAKKLGWAERPRKRK